MLKEMKWNMLLSAALYMVLGLIMLIFPATTAHTICYLLAGIAIVIGLVNLVVYFTRSITHNYYRNDFVTGLMLMILGFFRDLSGGSGDFTGAFYNRSVHYCQRPF